MAKGFQEDNSYPKEGLGRGRTDSFKGRILPDGQNSQRGGTEIILFKFFF